MAKRLGTAVSLLAAVCWLGPANSPGAAGGAKEHQPCGGNTGVQCDKGLWCDVHGACEEEDPAGVCVKVPGTCPKDRAPVCGCDGITYQNDCDRLVHKMQKDHDGECTDEPES